MFAQEEVRATPGSNPPETERAVALEVERKVEVEVEVEVGTQTPPYPWPHVPVQGCTVGLVLESSRQPQ